MISGSPALLQIVDTLATELQGKVDSLVELTEQVEEYQLAVDKTKKDIKRLKVALEALTGSSIPVGPEDEPVREEVLALQPPTSSREPATAPPAPVAYTPPPQKLGFKCTACGEGAMYPTARTLGSGRIVSLLVCTDCKNERPL